VKKSLMKLKIFGRGWYSSEFHGPSVMAMTMGWVWFLLVKNEGPPWKFSPHLFFYSLLLAHKNMIKSGYLRSSN